MTATATITSRREVGKAERRRRIIEAAASLVRERSFGDVSMTQIAERAEVAPATLYNLFQTKSAIFQQLFDQDIEAYARAVADAPAADALDRVFAAIDAAATLYERDPQFYRAMIHMGRDGVEMLRVHEPRLALWQGLVAAARDEGSLRPEAPPALLGVTLTHMMRGVFMDWATRSISARRLADEVTYGAALVLLPYAADVASEKLRARVQAQQTILAAASRNAC